MRGTACCLAAVCTMFLLGGTAQATVYVYDFPIDGLQEVPPVATTGVGTGHVTYDDVTNELAWEISYGSLIGTPSASHFHGPAGYGEIAGVQVNIATLSGGLASPMIGSTTITDIQEADLVAGLWYANIHSSFAPGGEIRGQVVPEPASFALLAVGVAALIRRRR